MISIKEKTLSDEDKSRLAKAHAKQAKKAAKAIDEGRCNEPKPNGSENVRSFSRVSKGRRKLWSRQYVRHKKTGVITEVVRI